MIRKKKVPVVSQLETFTDLCQHLAVAKMVLPLSSPFEAYETENRRIFELEVPHASRASAEKTCDKPSLEHACVSLSNLRSTHMRLHSTVLVEHLLEKGVASRDFKTDPRTCGPATLTNPPSNSATTMSEARANQTADARFQPKQSTEIREPGQAAYDTSESAQPNSEGRLAGDTSALAGVVRRTMEASGSANSHTLKVSASPAIMNSERRPSPRALGARA